MCIALQRLATYIFTFLTSSSCSALSLESNELWDFSFVVVRWCEDNGEFFWCLSNNFSSHTHIYTQIFPSSLNSLRDAVEKLHTISDPFTSCFMSTHNSSVNLASIGVCVCVSWEKTARQALRGSNFSQNCHCCRLYFFLLFLFRFSSPLVVVV